MQGIKGFFWSGNDKEDRPRIGVLDMNVTMIASYTSWGVTREGIFDPFYKILTFVKSFSTSMEKKK